MSAEPSCPDRGSALPHDAPAGLCPRCLLQAALSGGIAGSADELIPLREPESTDPQWRYATAEALARDLERWLGGEPIAARPATAWERAAKWARRRPAIAGLAAAVALLLILIVIGSSVAALRLHGEHQATLAHLGRPGGAPQRGDPGRLPSLRPAPGRQQLGARLRFWDPLLCRPLLDLPGTLQEITIPAKLARFTHPTGWLFNAIRYDTEVARGPAGGGPARIRVTIPGVCFSLLMMGLVRRDPPLIDESTCTVCRSG